MELPKENQNSNKQTKATKEELGNPYLRCLRDRCDVHRTLHTQTLPATHQITKSIKNQDQKLHQDEILKVM